MRVLFTLLFSVSLAGQQVITTFAGTDWVFTDSGKPGPNASIAQPVSLAVDSKNNVYIVDPFMNSVMKLSASGVITLVAGNGLRRSAGDGGPAIDALLQGPQGIAIDSADNIYIAEAFGNRVRRIGADGVITTIAGNGKAAFGGDGGPATQATLSAPSALAVDAGGNLYIRDNGNVRIRKVDVAGRITTIAGTGIQGVAGDGGLAIAAQIAGSGPIMVDRQGNLYVAEPAFCRVRKIDTSGIITTIAGTAACNSAGDNASATRAQLNEPSGMAFDAQGFLYISEKAGNRIRRIDPAGIITTTAGISGINGFAGDGANSAQAQFSAPVALAIDSQDRIYVADRDNQRVRRFSFGGNIVTAAGSGATIGDGGPAASARLSLAGRNRDRPGGQRVHRR